MSQTPTARPGANRKTVLTPVSDPLFGSLFSLRPWTTGLKSRRLIRSLTMRKLQERFRGSVLGAVWVFLLPLLMLAVYAFAFIAIFKIGGKDATTTERIELVLNIFVGLIFFGMFNESVQRAAVSIVSVPQFVKKVVFPLDALPIVAFTEHLVLALASILILLLGTYFCLDRIYIAWLLLPIPLVILAMITIGVGWILATIGVFVRDLSQALAVIMQMLFFLTPVCYTIELIPEQFLTYAMLNPMVPILSMTRGMVLHGELPDPATVLTMLAIGAACIQIGHAVFTAKYRRFADVL